LASIPDYHYPLQGQGEKRKTVASAIAVVLKRKKVKVLTHRPRYIEPVVVPKFGKGTSLAAKAKRAAPIVQSTEELIVVPKVPTVGPVEARDDKAEEPRVEKVIKTPEILSPPTKADLPKVQKIPAATPKRRRMASVLDAVIEITKALSPAPKKIAEAIKVQAKVESGPSVPTETKPAAPEDKTAGQIVSEKTEAPASEAPNEDVDYIIQHASGKKLRNTRSQTLCPKIKISEGGLSV
jgi:hypothetical protein